jgi:predicted nucleic acid-binding protein
MIKKIILDRMNNMRAKLKEANHEKLTKYVSEERCDEYKTRIDELQWLLKKVSMAEKNKSVVSDKEQLTEDIVNEVIGRLSSKM